MYIIDREKVGYQYDNDFECYFVEVAKDGSVLDKVLLPEHVREIYNFVSDEAIIKWHLEGCTEVEFEVEKGWLQTKRTSMCIGGFEVYMGNITRTIYRGYDSIEVVIRMMEDIESILQYDEELKKA